MTKVIRIVAAVIRNGTGQALLVRKRGTQAFMQPGGKREPGEDDLTALARELDEELGCRFDPAAARYLGIFTAPAANEPDHLVEAAVYDIGVQGGVNMQAEIEELVWIDPAQPTSTLTLAPLTRDQWIMLQRDNVATKRTSGLFAFDITPTPLAAVAPEWLGRFREGGRFAARRESSVA